MLRGTPRPARRVRRWAVPAAACMVGVVLVAAGWALGRAKLPGRRLPPPSAVAANGAPVEGVSVERVDLMAGGRWVGQAFAYPGEPSFVYVSLDTQMHDQTGPVSCSLERPDGSHVSLGMFQMRRGYRSWGASAQLDGNALRAATLVVWDATGNTIATARFSE